MYPFVAFLILLREHFFFLFSSRRAVIHCFSRHPLAIVSRRLLIPTLFILGLLLC